MNKKKWIQALAAGAALAAAALVWWKLSERPDLESEKPDRVRRVPVQTRPVSAYTQTLFIRAGGTVRPRRSLALIPQVRGRLVWVNPSLIAGGRLGREETIVRIDSRDYQQALERAQAALVRGQSALEMEKGRGRVAEKEWAYFQKRQSGDNPGDRSLALRRPQLASARALVRSRSADVRTARLNLDRTRIRAPFDTLVLEQSAAPGQVVSPRQPISQMVKTDVFDVHARVPPGKLGMIRFPGEGSEGSRAVVTLAAGDRSFRYRARVTGQVPAVDPRGRMATVIVSVSDPLTQNPDQPLLLNTFVSVEIVSRLQGTFSAVPREAVRYQSRVFLFKQGKLHIVAPGIQWRLPDLVLTDETIQPGDQVIVSPVPAPVEGMLLRRIGDADSGDPGQGNG